MRLKLDPATRFFLRKYDSPRKLLTFFRHLLLVSMYLSEFTQVSRVSLSSIANVTLSRIIIRHGNLLFDPTRSNLEIAHSPKQFSPLFLPRSPHAALAERVNTARPLSHCLICFALVSSFLFFFLIPFRRDAERNTIPGVACHGTRNGERDGTGASVEERARGTLNATREQPVSVCLA